MLQAPVWTRCTRPSTSHHLTLSLSPLSPAPVGSSDWLFDSIRLISHKANAPQQLERGEARQGIGGAGEGESSLSYPHDA